MFVQIDDGGAGAGCELCSRLTIRTSDNDVALVSLLLALSVFCA